MNIDPIDKDYGKISELTDQQLLEAIQVKKNVVQFGGGPISTMLLDRERQALEHIAQHQRADVLKNMRSKNKSANRRAKKKIADASRRRNRK